EGNHPPPPGRKSAPRYLPSPTHLPGKTGRPLQPSHHGRLLYTPRPRNPQSESVSMPRLPRTLRLILLGGVTLAVLCAIAAGILVMSMWKRLPDVQTLRSIELQ